MALHEKRTSVGGLNKTTSNFPSLSQTKKKFGASQPIEHEDAGRRSIDSSQYFANKDKKTHSMLPRIIGATPQPEDTGLQTLWNVMDHNNSQPKLSQDGKIRYPDFELVQKINITNIN